jgi:CC2D2A N-terminal C2 domain
MTSTSFDAESSRELLHAEDAALRRMATMRAEIKHLTATRELDESSNYKLLHRIVDQWYKVRSIREKNGFTSSTTQLIFDELARDEDEQRQMLQREVEFEVLEAREEHEWRYILMMERYNARVRAAAKQASGGAQPSTDVPKPLFPVFDEQEIRADITKRIIDASVPLDEPMLRPILRKDGKITGREGQLAQTETDRRKGVVKYRYYVILSLNGKDVAKTDVKELKVDFTVPFGEIMSVVVHKWPT